ncbi:MAG: oligoendopeptidase F [Chthoniobacter sp.]|nr:oligoendopeptidase F [Chthoniobacter sp.]
MTTKFFEKDEGGAGAIPARDQVPVGDTWDLTQLYATPADWQAAFEKVQRDYAGVAQWKGRVGESAATLRAVLEFDKELSLLIERLGHYASLLTSGDSSNAEHLAREAQFENLLTRIGEASAFVAPEIQAIDDATFDTLLKKPQLAEWVITLRKQRRYKPHTLTANEERLLALGSSALRGHGETFSQLTDVDMVFGKVADENGVERELTQSSYSSFLVKRDSDTRRRAFKAFYAEFDAHKFTVASTLANSIKADVFTARARNYPSAREAALFSDDMPVSVYDNLISTVRANLPALHRYYALRRRLLKLDEIHQYDTYVPIVDNIETDIPWDAACDKVLAALAPLGREYTTTLGAGLRGRWCDRYENKGKRSGAFSSSSFGNPPFILMNYKRDVFAEVYTLAHEAGHSMHTWYAQRTQHFQDYNYPIFLAEVASTFNEELLTHHLLAETTDPRMRAYLINRQIDDIRGTIYRQTMFAEFEKLTHAMEEAGEPLTLESFRATYRGLLDAYFGPDFAIDSELELECMRIPHFYRAFYVYKYATGLSAAVALAQQVLGGGDVERYLGFLRSGGAKMPLPTLAEAGVDMSQPAPIAAALAVFAQRVEELEKLLG